jgi:AAA domain
MGLFSQAKNDICYLKSGFFGFSGSGKTWTAAQLAAGLHQYIKASKPVYFLDTEQGSSFVKSSIFDPLKIPLMVVKTRAFKDLKPAIEEAEKEASVLIIDSISHPWYELCSAYLRSKKSGGKFISISDWQPIKEAWRMGYSDPYLNSNLHIIMCGRASNIFEDVEDVDATEKAGKEVYKSIQVGTKMRTESETGYEPHILCEMEKVYIAEGGKYVRRCAVIKERFGVLDSKDFDNPTFKDFLPHIERLFLGGVQGNMGLATSGELFSDDKSRSWFAEKRAREVILEEVEGLLVAAYPGQSAEEKRIKAESIRKAFGGYSWAALADRSSTELGKGLAVLREAVYNDLESKGMLDAQGNIVAREKVAK